MPWREPPADQKVVSSNCISSAVNRLQGAKRLSPSCSSSLAAAETEADEGEY